MPSTRPTGALLVMDAQEAVAAARQAGVPVVCVVIALRDGHPETRRGGGLEGDRSTRVHPELLRAWDVVTVDGWAGTTLRAPKAETNELATVPVYC